MDNVTYQGYSEVVQIGALSDIDSRHKTYVVSPLLLIGRSLEVNGLTSFCSTKKKEAFSFDPIETTLFLVPLQTRGINKELPTVHDSV